MRQIAFHGGRWLVISVLLLSAVSAVPLTHRRKADQRAPDESSATPDDGSSLTSTIGNVIGRSESPPSNDFRDNRFSALLHHSKRSEALDRHRIELSQAPKAAAVAASPASVPNSDASSTKPAAKIAGLNVAGLSPEAAKAVAQAMEKKQKDDAEKKKKSDESKAKKAKEKKEKDAIKKEERSKEEEKKAVKKRWQARMRKYRDNIERQMNATTNAAETKRDQELEKEKEKIDKAIRMKRSKLRLMKKRVAAVSESRFKKAIGMSRKETETLRVRLLKQKKEWQASERKKQEKENEYYHQLRHKSEEKQKNETRDFEETRQRYNELKAKYAPEMPNFSITEEQQETRKVFPVSAQDEAMTIDFDGTVQEHTVADWDRQYIHPKLRHVEPLKTHGRKPNQTLPHDHSHHKRNYTAASARNRTATLENDAALNDGSYRPPKVTSPPATAKVAVNQTHSKNVNHTRAANSSRNSNQTQSQLGSKPKFRSVHHHLMRYDHKQREAEERRRRDELEEQRFDDEDQFLNDKDGFYAEGGFRNGGDPLDIEINGADALRRHAKSTIASEVDQWDSESGPVKHPATEQNDENDETELRASEGDDPEPIPHLNEDPAHRFRSFDEVDMYQSDSGDVHRDGSDESDGDEDDEGHEADNQQSDDDDESQSEGQRDGDMAEGEAQEREDQGDGPELHQYETNEEEEGPFDDDRSPADPQGEEGPFDDERSPGDESRFRQRYQGSHARHARRPNYENDREAQAHGDEDRSHDDDSQAHSANDNTSDTQDEIGPSLSANDGGSASRDLSAADGEDLAKYESDSGAVASTGHDASANQRPTSNDGGLEQYELDSGPVGR